MVGLVPWPDEQGRWAGHIACLSAGFQDNIQAMIDVLGKPVSLPGDSLQAWGIALEHPDGRRSTPRALKSLSPQPEAPATCWMHVYRETVTDPADGACDQCRIMGWNVHPMCRTTWHIVIPAPEDATPNALHDDASPVVCMVECALRGNDVPAVQASDIAVGCLESSRHLLHGLLHGNGYGHLLRLNGRDAAAAGDPPRPASRTPHGPGSTSRRRLRSMPSLQMQPLHVASAGSSHAAMPRPRGRRVMDLWDALCTLLRVYEMGMDLRVLLPAATGATFYGNWGFGFGRAGYGRRREDWDAAVATLATTPLSDIQTAYRNEFTTSAVLHRYQQAAQASAGSQSPTLKDLLSVMLAASYNEPLAAAVLTGQAPPLPIAHDHTSTAPVSTASAAALKATVACFAAATSACAPRLLTKAVPVKAPAAQGQPKKQALNKGSKRGGASAPSSDHEARATKRARKHDAVVPGAAKQHAGGGRRRGSGRAPGGSEAPPAAQAPTMKRATTRNAGTPNGKANATTPKKMTPKKNTTPKNMTPKNMTPTTSTNPPANGTAPSPLPRELRSLLRDLGDAQGPAPSPGPRRVVRPSFYNPSLQQPVVVLATGPRGNRTPGHGGEGSCAHTSLGHLGLVGEPPPLPGGAGPAPGAPWGPDAAHGACAQARADLKHVWGAVLSPPRRKGGVAWQAALQVLCDTKHFVKDYGGTALAEGLVAGVPPGVARVLLSLRLHGAVLPPFLVAGEDGEGDADGDDGAVRHAHRASTPVRKQKKKHKWTRHKGAHRKPPAAEHVTNDAASAHTLSAEGGFPPTLLAAAARDAAVARGLRARLRTEIPPLVLCVPRTTQASALLATARRVLGSMYPLLDALTLAVPHTSPVARTTRGGGHKPKAATKAAPKGALPGEVLAGGVLLVDATLSTPWSAAWRFSGGGVAWVVRCSCGIFDDDGNHMVLCDGCGFWMHSRCEGLADEGAPPPRFMCSSCRK